MLSVAGANINTMNRDREKAVDLIPERLRAQILHG